LLKKSIRDIISATGTKDVLHVPFARMKTVPEDNGEWDEGWFAKLMSDTGIPVFDAGKSPDVGKSSGETIFINGGRGRIDLLESVENSRRLLDKILNAKFIVAESAGSMLMGEYMRVSREDGSVVKALGILKNTVIEPHYTERGYNKFLPEDMKKSGVKYGLGIDSATGIATDPKLFPDQWEKLGPGNVYIITAP